MMLGMFGKLEIFLHRWEKLPRTRCESRSSWPIEHGKKSILVYRQVKTTVGI
jgi:hypothetical protein